MEEEKLICEECGADIGESIAKEIRDEARGENNLTLVPSNTSVIFQEKQYILTKMLCVDCTKKRLEKLKGILAELGYFEMKDTFIPYEKIQKIREGEDTKNMYENGILDSKDMLLNYATNNKLSSIPVKDIKELLIQLSKE